MIHFKILLYLSSIIVFNWNLEVYSLEEAEAGNTIEEEVSQSIEDSSASSTSPEAKEESVWLWSSSRRKNNNNRHRGYASGSSDHYGYAMLEQGFGGGAAGPIYICGWLGGFEGLYPMGGYGPPDVKEVAFVATQRIISRMPSYWEYL